MLIDKSPADWLLNIEPLRANGPLPDCTWYALLDSAFVPACYKLMQQRKKNIAIRYLFDLATEPKADLAAVSPVVFALTATTADAWHPILQQTDGWPMLTLIASPESLDELSARLASWCVVDADGQPFVLRFADTRRLPDVVSVLTQVQHGAFFGPAQAAMYRDRTGQWVGLPMPQTPLPAAASVHFSADQFGALVGASEADENLAALNTSAPAMTANRLPSQAHMLIEQALTLATNIGINGPDRGDWCRLQLQYPDVLSLPDTENLLQQFKQGQMDYDTLAQQLVDVAQAAERSRTPTIGRLA